MNNKNLLRSAVALSLTCSALSVSASLSTNALLQLDAQTGFCSYDLGTYPDACTVKAIPASNYFAMDEDGSDVWEDDERVGFEAGAEGGFILFGTQTDHGTDGATGTTLETGKIDAGWEFFGSHGWHTTNAVPTIASDDNAGNVTLGMTGWTVHWNGGDIDMGAGADAVVTCGSTCEDGDTFTLDYNAVVPTGSFAGVAYALHLEGVVSVCTGDIVAPSTVNDSYNIATDTPTPLILQANDTDSGCSGLDTGTVDIDPAGGIQTSVTTTAGGTATVDTVTGVVTYTPASTYTGNDSFTYTISDRAGNTSSTTTVNIDVADYPPVCNNDDLSDGAYVNLADVAFINIDVLANDTPRTNSIVPTTVTILSDVSNGGTVIEADGTITYTPTIGFEGTDSFTYEVTDDGGLTCDFATVNILVSDPGPDIGGVSNAYLVMTSGTVDDVGVQPALGQGAWFSMETSPGVFTYVPVVGFDHIQLGTTQSGDPTAPGIDSPWSFFGNLGSHLTNTDLIQLSNDGSGNASLNFSGWAVSWNGIASIPMGEGQDNGIATMTCYTDMLTGTQGTCATGEEFLVEYRAIVPVGDPSGFGGVNYAVHFEGVISQDAPLYGCPLIDAPLWDVVDVSVIDDCSTSIARTFTPGLIADAANNTTGLYLTAEDMNNVDPLLNPNDGEMCIGGCLDFIINDFTTDHVEIVVKLNAPIQSGAVYRKLNNGTWSDFDVSANDQIGSALADAGTGNCQGPEGEFKIGLRNGYECLYLKIYDGGPNDADGIVNGTIVDPGGILIPGSPNVPESSAVSGCSMSATPVALRDRADWLVVAGFIGFIALFRLRRKQV